VLGGPFDAAGSELWLGGAIFPQSRASMSVARAVAPAPGARVLDLCAAPGGKTTHLAALMRGEGEVVAVEQHGGRAEALRQTCERMRIHSVQVVTGDAAAFTTSPGGPFDYVLADPPCSGLGTVQSRPDLRWRATADRIAELARLQSAILAAAAAATAPGGTLVYSVCTITNAETDAVIDAFLGEHPGFAREVTVRTFPHRDGTDGFFICRMGGGDRPGAG
jgi:16S rRNA (cytosine967-C5)-methyltransferase